MLEEISNNHFDFINLGASLQYIEDYEILLDKITNLKSYVLISAIPVYKSKNKSQNKFIIVKQAKNSAGNYLYFFNKDYLFSIFKNKNFDIILEQDNPTDNVNLKNFEKIVSVGDDNNDVDLHIYGLLKIEETKLSISNCDIDVIGGTLTTSNFKILETLDVSNITVSNIEIYDLISGPGFDLGS